MILRRLRAAIVLALVLSIARPRPAAAYSLLTHEQLIDLTWDDSIVPLLLSRYPGLTPAQLDEARAYAYGGCVIQDIGYYPAGDLSFSDLTHYVRSGDFVVNLFRNAKNADQLAFAIGALSHYVGDSIGHSLATNLAVPAEFPKLRRKYGRVVNYAEGKHQHVQVEFAFDISEISRHRMAPLQYLRHIGLRVPVKQLALAYYQTYGLSDEFSGRRRRFNVREYRFAVRTFIPRIAFAVTVLHRRHEPPEPDIPEAAEIAKEIAAVSVSDNWPHYRRKAGVTTYVLAGLVFILPKVGPLKLVAVKGPTPASDREYIHSVAVSMAVLRRHLTRFTPPSARRHHAEATAAVQKQAAGMNASGTAGNTVVRRLSAGSLHPLPNLDLDTGNVVRPGGYPLTDFTYAKLLHRLTRRPSQSIPPGIKRDILGYYADPDAPITTKKDPGKWAQVQADLATLAKMPTSTEPEPYPTYAEDAAAGSQ
ncbi:MAG: zinc dependent phospholipase C family protein [Terracidiphilus sp.]